MGVEGVVGKEREKGCSLPHKRKNVKKRKEIKEHGKPQKIKIAYCEKVK